MKYIGTIFYAILFAITFSGKPAPELLHYDDDCSTTYYNDLLDKIPGEVKAMKLIGNDANWYALKSKILQRCSWSGEKPIWWLTIIYLESGESFKHDTVNHLGYQGAVQLSATTHREISKNFGFTTPFSEFKELPVYRQIDYMFCYINSVHLTAARKGRYETDSLDLYLSWLYPRAVHTGDYAFGPPASGLARCNSGFTQKFGNWEGWVTRLVVSRKLNSFRKRLCSLDFPT